jgi:hypothetical protein
MGMEEGRATSKSPHETFGYFLSISHQEVSAHIIQNSAVGNFSPKIEDTNTKAARCLFFLMSFAFLDLFEFFAIFSYCLHLLSLSAC